MVFSPKNLQLRRKKWCWDKIREQTDCNQLETHDVLRYVCVSLRGPSRGDTHTGALDSLCRIRLQSVLSADFLCDACCVRVSRYSFCTRILDKSNPNFSAKFVNFSAQDHESQKKREKKISTKTNGRKNEHCDDDCDVFVVQHQHQRRGGATESERALV